MYKIGNKALWMRKKRNRKKTDVTNDEQVKKKERAYMEGTFQ